MRSPKHVNIFNIFLILEIVVEFLGFDFDVTISSTFIDDFI
jgi:hypothetical protein